MRRGIHTLLGAALGAAVALGAVGVAGWLLLLRGGMSARREPGALEARVARVIRDRSIPAEARDARNPIPATPGALADGRAHFADHCASCHANDGSGQTPLGRGLYPRAPDLRKPATQQLTDGALFHVIENGIRFTGMPAWGARGTADASWHLVHFIRHLPRLTEEERIEMEALNPRSPDEWRALQDEDAFLHGDPVGPRGARGVGHGHGEEAR